MYLFAVNSCTQENIYVPVNMRKWVINLSKAGSNGPCHQDRHPAIRLNNDEDRNGALPYGGMPALATADVRLAASGPLLEPNALSPLVETDDQ